ncbi:hypothetical protein BLTE_07000 [Blastochloris tepida]|uniref:Methylisocitrate lyase n=1 Tax=Blastochloris tepida TaxID=2233851 RepID=A0A348FXI2_9HYPH|nr:hypothetical protein BLTE_07000 [Blastochloris tepida]
MTTTTRQSRKGEISSWKAYAPAFAGKMAVEAVDRVMRGEGAPSPAWEGEDGFIAWMLGGPQVSYLVRLPEKGEPKRAILETYTKEHSAEYQSQALIDLARRMRPRIGDLARVKSIVIHTSHHTHYVIGTGAGDPQKMDPTASRETLDHSIMYIFALALEDGGWHHVKSYTPERAARPSTVALWHRISTVEDSEWTRRYHSHDPKEKAFGGRVVVTLNDGRVIEDSIAVADAHPLGARPFERSHYIAKFRALADGIMALGCVLPEPEDQILPKKCGHLNGKKLASACDMASKVAAAATARRHLYLIARTDAAATEGLDGAVARAKLYVEAGADAIFPEALTDAEMFRAFAERLPGVPLLANMTEFGRTPTFTAAEFEAMGYRMVIWPVSSLRVAAKAQEKLYAALARDGSTMAMQGEMQTRAELYDLIGLAAYEALDASIVATVLPTETNED